MIYGHINIQNTYQKLDMYLHPTIMKKLRNLLNKHKTIFIDDKFKYLKGKWPGKYILPVTFCACEIWGAQLEVKMTNHSQHTTENEFQWKWTVLPHK